MNVVCRWSLATVLMVTALHGNAVHGSDAVDGNGESRASECLRKEVEGHVRQQYAIYGPQSVSHEYFGFIYLHDGIIGSAVMRSRQCSAAGKCVVDSNEAIQSIPRFAKVLGEWHTHPHDGSVSLSSDDVRGAYSNRHISCYLAFYSTPSGEIYAWNPKRISVPIAMASRAKIGNYTAKAIGQAAVASRNSD
jgi:hypothetical protein